MNYVRIPRCVFACIVLLFSAIMHVEIANAQQVVPAPEPQPSPLAMAAKKFDGDTYVKITYSSPRRRDPKTGQPREIFGSLVPYGEVWRFGANEATELTATSDIEFAGKRIPAGTYALFAIPGEDKWTLIVNKDLGQWGAYSYKQESDLLRVEVPVTESAGTYEAFTIQFEEDNPNLNVMWEKTMLVIPIQPL